MLVELDMRLLLLLVYELDAGAFVLTLPFTIVCDAGMFGRIQLSSLILTVLYRYISNRARDGYSNLRSSE